MNTPLGRAAGNWLEVKESVKCLESRAGVSPAPRARQREQFESFSPTSPARAGETPALLCNDLRTLVLDSAAHLLVQTRKSKSLTAARKLAEDCLNSGEPRQKWDKMIVAQGADLKAFYRKLTLDSTAEVVVEVKSEKAGYVSKCDARIIGEVIRDLGGGRLTKDSAINFDVGVDWIAKPGERVEKPGTLCRVHAADSVQARTAVVRLNAAFEISTKRPAEVPLIVEVIH
jgi:thymidine phosphorylase